MLHHFGIAVLPLGFTLIVVRLPKPPAHVDADPAVRHNAGVQVQERDVDVSSLQHGANPC